MIKMIFACGENGEFGKADGLPWDVPEDLAHFKEYTSGCAMVMSGATFASLPGKLPGRLHYVLSDRVTVAKNGAKPDFQFATNIPLREVCGDIAGNVVVIGGREMLTEAAEFVDAASITIIDDDEISEADFFVDVGPIMDVLNDRLVFVGNGSGENFHVMEWS